jgi:hypothetical protein
MAPEHAVDWAGLAGDYSSELLDGVRGTLEQADSSVLDPALLGPSFNSDVATTTKLLQEVARLGYLASEEVTLCGNCPALASTEDRAAGTCPRCGKRYDELDKPFRSKVVFRRPAGRQSRDVSWVVTVHGMNTDGPWQQDFSWLIANKLRYSAPVLILKYPVFRVMVLFARTQRLLVADLGRRMRAAVEYARLRRGEMREAPDVVLHSYGTLLFSQLLLEPEFATLRFGRVILAGSIVRPDYDWTKHLSSGRIEQVINHCGDKDWVVGLAQFTIPHSGPSGRIGFVDRAVRNVKALGYGHGTFFDLEPMKANLALHGSWDRFLTYPQDQLVGDAGMAGPSRWLRPWAGSVSRWLLTLLALALGPLVWFGMQLYSAIGTIIKGR